MRADLNPRVYSRQVGTINGCSDPAIEQDRFCTVAGVVLRVEHGGVPRKDHLSKDIGHDGDRWRRNRNEQRQRGKSFLNRSHCTAMITEFDCEKMILAVYGLV